MRRPHPVEAWLGRSFTRATFAFGLLLSAGPPGTTHAGTLCGRVVSEGWPIAFANVRVLGTVPRVGCLTDTCGWFRVDSLPPGPYTVEVAAIGFDKAIVEAETSPSEQCPAIELTARGFMARGIARRRAACIPFLSLDYFQGDNAPPPGHFIFCGNAYWEHADDPATQTGRLGRLELKSPANGCSLLVRWFLNRPARPTVTILDHTGEPVHSFPVAKISRSDSLWWDGRVVAGSLDFGEYSVVLQASRHSRDDLRLQFSMREPLKPPRCDPGPLPARPIPESAR